MSRLRGVTDLLYGPGPVQAALDEVTATPASWGTSPHAGDQVTQAVLDLLLTCGSPCLADVTDEALKTLVAEYPAGSIRRRGLFKVSRVPAHLGVIAAPLTTNHHNRGPWAQTLESVPAPWWDWALRWRRLSTLEPLTVSARFSTILVAGRWAAQHHPEAVTPDQWTRDIAAEYSPTL